MAMETMNILKIVLSMLFLFIVILPSGKCADNETNYYPRIDKSEFRSKQNRLLSFNTLDNGDVSVELAFSVPFISIPVKKSLSMAQGSLANVNIGAVLLAGGIVFAVVLLPVIMMFLYKQFTVYPNRRDRKHRSEDDTTEYWRFLDYLDGMLLENSIDSTTCMQHLICSTIKTSSQNLANGNANSKDKIIDELSKSVWLQEIIDGTAIYYAVKDGFSGRNCSKIYPNCKVIQNILNFFKKELPV